MFDVFLILAILYTSLFSFSFIVFNRKLLSPSVIFTASLSVVIWLAYIMRESMGFEVAEKTFMVMSIGGVLFVLTEFLVVTYYNSVYWKRKTKLQSRYDDKKYLYIYNQTLNFMFVILLFSLFLAIASVFYSTSGNMEAYKNIMVKGGEGLKFRFVLNQLFKLNTAFANICGFIAIYNISIKNDIILNQRKYLIFVAAYGVYTIFSQGARQPLIESVLFIILIYISLKQKNEDYKDLWTVVSRIIVALPILAFLFTKTAELVGRRAAERQVMTYITAYLSGGLYSFNLHINEAARNNVFGESSFADIHSFLYKIGVSTIDLSSSYHSFDLYGNTVTIFGRWYEDFGPFGVYIMTMMVAFFFSVFFYKYIHPNARNNGLLSKIIYCKLVIALVWAGYDDRIRALFSFSTLNTIILMIIIYRCFVEKHIVIRFGGH